MSTAESIAGTKPTVSVLYKPLLLVSLAFTFLGFSLPVYSKALGASAVQIGGLFSIFTATLLVGRPIVGWALDRYGRRRFLIAALVGYAVTMALFSFAGTLAGLYAARFIQGIASALMWITVNTIVADLSAQEQRGQTMGQVTEVRARGELLGVFLGFILFTRFAPQTGWMVTFAVYAALTVAGAWFAFRDIPETRPRPSSRDGTEADQAARDIAPPGGPAAGGAPGRVSPTLLKLLVVVLVSGFATALIAPIFLIFLQDRFNAGIETLAWAFLPAGIVYSLLPSRLGRLSDRFGRAPLMAAGLVTAGVLFALLPAVPSLIGLAVLYTLSAVGWSMAGPAEAAMVADLTGNEWRGRAYGLYEFAAALGATIGPLLGGWLYDTAGHAVPFRLTAATLFLAAAWVMIFLRSARVQA